MGNIVCLFRKAGLRSSQSPCSGPPQAKERACPMPVTSVGTVAGKPPDEIVPGAWVAGDATDLTARAGA
ncbi:hypothetical protein GCM10023083_56780 [Streptomyces phyllanthi]